jgi:amino acid transporter
MFPEKFSQVSERTHTPIYASLLNIVLMCLCAGLAFSVYGYLVSAANTSFFTALYYFAFALAAIALPYKRPEIWEKGLAKKIFGLPEMTVLGAICAALMVWVMGLSAIGVNEQAWNVTEVWILIGFLVLVYYIWKNRKMGINFMDIYKEIPPP